MKSAMVFAFWCHFLFFLFLITVSNGLHAGDCMYFKMLDCGKAESDIFGVYTLLGSFAAPEAMEMLAVLQSHA